MNTLIDNNDYFNIYTLSKALSSYTQEELASELIKKKKQRDGLDFQITVNKECVTTIGCDNEEDFLKKYSKILTESGILSNKEKDNTGIIEESGVIRR